MSLSKQARREEEDRAATLETLTGDDDILTEILIRLPVKSLLRFKSVSKPWLSLISSPHFCVLVSKRCSKHIRGLLLRKLLAHNPRFDFVPLEPGQTAPFERLDFVDDERGGLDLIQYCNGLLLCCSSCCGDRLFVPSKKSECKYYVFNPTTRQHTVVPVTRVLESAKASKPYIVHLSFDPRISPHYKLLCGYMTETGGLDPRYHYEFAIYSSKTGLMRQLADHFHTNIDLLDECQMYRNGAINWIVCGLDSLYFNSNEERIGTLPMPPEPEVMEGIEIDEWGEWSTRVVYYGESYDRLYLVLSNINLTPQFNVYELDREYSGWFVRFHVDLRPVFRLFPEAVNQYSHPLHYLYYSFGILSIVEKDDGENSFLVLSVTGKAIRFNVKDGSFTKMCDFPAVGDFVRRLLPYRWYDSIQLAESLHPL